MHLIIAIVLLMGPGGQVTGGTVLPGASTDMPSCEKKVEDYLKQLHSLPPNTVAVSACAELAAGDST